jgi:hypothetical protein
VVSRRPFCIELNLMSTKIAPWAKWPSEWLKTLPKGDLADPKKRVLGFGTGSPAPECQTGSEGLVAPPGAIHRFEDFVERPLRSLSQRQAKKSRGRPAGETGNGSGGDDGSVAPGA